MRESFSVMLLVIFFISYCSVYSAICSMEEKTVSIVKYNFFFPFYCSLSLFVSLSYASLSSALSLPSVLSGPSSLLSHLQGHQFVVKDNKNYVFHDKITFQSLQQILFSILSKVKAVIFMILAVIVVNLRSSNYILSDLSNHRNNLKCLAQIPLSPLLYTKKRGNSLRSAMDFISQLQ